tara:strand:- start:974 stop:3544 length:2571 start_codon:yes stop_codon:yes gene_type:complete
VAGRINVGRPRRIKHIPLSWDVNKARSNHQPKYRPVGDAILRGREKGVGKLMEQMFQIMPSVDPLINGTMTEAEYFEIATEISEPYVTRIAEQLQIVFNEGSLMQQDRIRADYNEQLKRLKSPLRLTDDKGYVTKDVTSVGGVEVGKNPKAVWAPIGLEAFDEVNSASVQYARFRSGTLITAMLDEQQRVLRDLIGDSFTTAQTFNTGRTVTGLTTGQTSRALLEVLEEMKPATPIARSLAEFRGVNAVGLTHPWERAVFHRAEKIATSLADKGITGAKAYAKIQTDTQKYANKLRRSRARMISRTEIKRAQVQGQLASMREALDSGLADPATSGKKWITGATDVCNICSDLGFSRAIHLDQSFEGVGDGPPAHPNCRCDLDFSHKIKEAPKAVGAGNPNFPAGTPENPIVWQFNSGFQTQPNVTTRFMPPSVPATPVAALPPKDAPSDMTPAYSLDDSLRGTPAYYDDVPTRRATDEVFSDEVEVLGTFTRQKQNLDPALEIIDEAFAPALSTIGTRSKTIQFRFTPNRPKDSDGLGGTYQAFKLIDKPKRLKPPKRLDELQWSGEGFRKSIQLENWAKQQSHRRGQAVTTVDESASATAGRIVRSDTPVYDDLEALAEKYGDKLYRNRLDEINEIAEELFDDYVTYGYKTREEMADEVYEWTLRKETRDADIKWYDETYWDGGKLPEPRFIRVHPDDVGAEINSIIHEIGHDYDYMSEIKIFLKDGTEDVIASNISNMHLVFQAASQDLIDYDTVGSAGRAILDFLETSVNSKAIKYYSTYPDATYAAYATNPKEIFARAFNQWTTTRHGTTEAVESMMAKALSSSGYQWDPVEFDTLIAPALEKVMRAFGMIE